MGGGRGGGGGRRCTIYPVRRRVRFAKISARPGDYRRAEPSPQGPNSTETRHRGGGARGRGAAEPPEPPRPVVAVEARR